MFTFVNTKYALFSYNCKLFIYKTPLNQSKYIIQIKKYLIFILYIILPEL